ncbi:trace amine-associated receptor 13c-like [Mugil cephalus]|uniref:trace amine-associated receptor 13c-like n=1 Tax=Mugil cephalus TaxID=48193 RepID=UPI001FB679A6|nr:trace amine-associated receptor 13c-like [Mugil cephalus]
MEIQDKVELCFPHLLNTSCRKPTLHWFEAVLLNILLSSISVITVVLNLLVIISVSHFRQLHTPTNILLLSLAMSDFLVGLLLMPVEIFRKTNCWIFGDALCSLYCYVCVNIICASIGNIVLISIDRCVAICYPMHYPNRITVSRVQISVCVCWLYSAFYSSFYVKDVLIQPDSTKFCFGECVLAIDYITGTIDFVLNFIIPVTVIIVLYLIIFVVAVSQARAMRSHVTAVTVQISLTLTRKKSELKAARTLGVLVVVYLICYCPYYFYVAFEDNVISNASGSAVVFFIYFNSCLNPVIYALFYPWFRNSVKHIVTLRILKPDSCEANIL